VIATVNAGTHFDEYGRQLMLEAYPSLVSGTWLYLNYAVSRDPIFPSVSYGGELYHSLPKGFECSLGARHMQYSSAVDIYTGTLAKYVGNYYLILRGNYIPSSVGPSHSGSLTTRRYFGDPDSWVSLVVSDGLSPTQYNPASAILSLNSHYLELEGQFKLGRRYFVSPSVSYEQDEVTPGNWRDDLTVSLSLACRF
jgi:YaiO family outer membrane protein